MRDWSHGRTSPSGVRARRLAELAEITDRLVKPIEALDDAAPIDLIAAGRVLAVFLGDTAPTELTPAERRRVTEPPAPPTGTRT